MLSGLLKHWQFVILVVALVTAGIAVRSARDARAELEASKLELTTQRRLNDSTVARLASTTADRDALHGVLIAKDQLQGKLLAGVVIRVPARDTVLVHDTLVTTLEADSTRRATFRDSTFAGVLNGVVTAPPCCAPLQLHYALTRPAFSPSVGFVQVGSKVAAVVVWQGERVEVDAPYATFQPAPKRLGTFVEGGVSYPNQAPFGRAGAFVRPGWGLAAFGAVEQTFDHEPARLQFGLRKEF